MGNLIIKKKELNKIACKGGDIYHILKSNESSFDNFGEAYFSWIDHFYVKGWKRHLKMTCNLVVPIGTVNFVFF